MTRLTTACPKPTPRLKKERQPIARTRWLPRSTKAVRAINPVAKARREKAYRKFLASALWQRIRMATFELFDFTCRCGYVDESRTGIGLVCNHLTYARFGGQEIVGEDTECLCRECDKKETTSTRANWMQPRRRAS